MCLLCVFFVLNSHFEPQGGGAGGVVKVFRRDDRALGNWSDMSGH